MASLGIAPTAGLRGSSLNSWSGRTKFVPEAQEIRFTSSTPSLPDRLIRFATNVRAPRQISANARQCAERNSKTDAKNTIHVPGPCTLVEREIVPLAAGLEGNGMAVEELCLGLLKQSGLEDMDAREAFASRGDITEANMERLVESLLHEEGQSAEDYQQRAVMFGKITEFFSQGKAYTLELEKSWTGASEITRTMQVIVDVVLAEEGRAATDYKCRAQLFAKSAEVFPFATGVRSS